MEEASGLQNFLEIVTKPDNIPIVAMLILVIFFTWLGLREAFKNDKLIEEGREDEIPNDMDVSACSTKHLKEIPPLSRFAKGGIKEALMRDSIRLARIFINLFRVENALGDRLPIAVGVLAKETTPITFMAC